MSKVLESDRSYGSPITTMQIAALNITRAHGGYIMWSVPKNFMKHISIGLYLDLVNQLSSKTHFFWLLLAKKTGQ